MREGGRGKKKKKKKKKRRAEMERGLNRTGTKEKKFCSKFEVKLNLLSRMYRYVKVNYVKGINGRQH
jgi:hypothetical protein